MSNPDGRTLYLAAMRRYAMDAEFHARVKRIEFMIIAAEDNTPTEAARVGIWVGIATALYLTDLKWADPLGAGT